MIGNKRIPKFNLRLCIPSFRNIKKEEFKKNFPLLSSKKSEVKESRDPVVVLILVLIIFLHDVIFVITLFLFMNYSVFIY